jgi:hypothetical protein
MTQDHSSQVFVSYRPSDDQLLQARRELARLMALSPEELMSTIDTDQAVMSIANSLNDADAVVALVSGASEHEGAVETVADTTRLARKPNGQSLPQGSLDTGEPVASVHGHAWSEQPKVATRVSDSFSKLCLLVKDASRSFATAFRASWSSWKLRTASWRLSKTRGHLERVLRIDSVPADFDLATLERRERFPLRTDDSALAAVSHRVARSEGGSIAERLTLTFKRIAFLVTALVLFAATADGFFALFNTHFPNPWAWGLALALALAAIVDGVLIGALLKWMKTRGFAALVALLVLMGISCAASTNFWYRQIRGFEKTIELFNLQRDRAMEGLIAMRDRLEDAHNGLEALAAHSRKMANREGSRGDSCERLRAKAAGPRQRFRTADAVLFEGLQQDLAPLPSRLRAEIETVRALRPQTGQTLVRAERQLQLAAANASSIVGDPVLTRIASQLRQRIDEEQESKVDGKVAYNCADSTIRTLAGTAVARLENLPNLPRIAVYDWSNPGAGLGLIPMVLNVQTWGTPGGLSGMDAVVVLLAVFVELALCWTARGFAHAMPQERVPGHLPRPMEVPTDEVLTFVRALSKDPDPDVRELANLMHRYRMRILFCEFLIVSQGCRDAHVQKLAWCAPIFVAIGLARRVRMLPSFVFNVLGWLKWQETHGCERREAYRLDLAAMDELQLAEVISRVRVTGAGNPWSSEQAHEASARAGPERRRHLSVVP